ncbi:MAG: hypothetical protein HN353_09865 [Bdellovibrionales bacterium]|jgi:hypothetical protein|nr:hypothetical protein [Bdellovibrionales bacterium]MBT3527205.1 hypothetical protein [Bdellovibrionales bacterium]MBT7668612.1 hypothetical protein [Bdellovibrionales bacterium]
MMITRQSRNVAQPATVFGLKVTLGVGLGILAGVTTALVATPVMGVALPVIVATKTGCIAGGATGMLKGLQDES